MKKNTPISRSGRFESGPDAEVADFTESVSFDRRLWWHDILGSKVHALVLKKAGLLTAAEFHGITTGLSQIEREISQGKFQWKPELEDVHMNIEAELTRRVPAGAKLHTGRSRNDQVALDLRLWLSDEIVNLSRDLAALQRALVEMGRKNAEVIIPGYTHLQRAQPVYFAHHLLAYVEMLQRDQERLSDCCDRLGQSPLGSGALAGTTLPLDREFAARMLDFVDDENAAQVTLNSMDAVSDRDFVVEFCSIAALIAVHFSRLAEDLILWSSSEFNFIRIADAYTTGSSMMPQKKNPDVAELVRGKSGRVIGNLVAVLTMLKGLPMTYNRDLQEDKESLFDTADTVRSSARLLAGMLRNTNVNATVCAAAAADPLLLATDLADYLVRKGIPFRKAHHVVGVVVAKAERLGKRLNELTVAELKTVDKTFSSDASAVFDLEKAMARRSLTGSPGTREVKKQLARWRSQLLALGTKESPPVPKRALHNEVP